MVGGRTESGAFRHLSMVGTSLIFAAALLVFAAAIPVSAIAANSPYMLGDVWPSLPRGAYLEDARGLAVDSSGTVVVANGICGTIQCISSDGTLLSEFGSPGSGPGQFNWPTDVAIDALGNYYVTDMGNSRVQKLDTEGRFIRAWGEYGSGTAQFIRPQAVAVDTLGNVYVAEDSRIQVFDTSGRRVRVIGTQGSAPGQFRFIQDIAVDAFGSIYVADMGNDRIQKLDSSGVYQAQWTEVDGRAFDKPQGVALASDGRVYVSDANGQRVVALGFNGASVISMYPEWPERGSFLPAAVAVGPNGEVFASSRGVHRFDSQGVYLGAWRSAGSSSGRFDMPAGIALGAGDEVVVAERIAGPRIQSFSLTGRHIATVEREELFGVSGGIAIDSTGNRYVPTVFGWVFKLDPSGNTLAKWEVPETSPYHLEDPEDVAASPSGAIYVLDTQGKKVVQFKADGTIMRSWGTYGSGPGQFDWPAGITVGSDGSVYVADTQNNRIQKFTASGTFLAAYGSWGSTPGKFSHPVDVAVDSSGRMFVTDSNNNRVQMLSSSGKVLAVWGTAGTAPGQFNGPAGIAVTEDGEVVVADQGNNRIQRFVPFSSVSAASRVTCAASDLKPIADSVLRLNGEAVANGPLVHTPIVIQGSQDGSTWWEITRPVTNALGEYTVSVDPSTARRFRAVLEATAKSQPATSTVVTVSPVKRRVTVTNPSAPATAYRSKKFTVSGRLTPRHEQNRIILYKYRYVSGKWKLSGYSLLPVRYRDFASSSYSGSVSLPYAGRWRLRAVAAADSKHLETWSTGYDEVVVK